MPRFKMKVKVKSELKGLKELGRKLSKQKDMIAEVGHFDAKQHSSETEETIAGISLINQQGTDRIPSRPYMLMAITSPAYVKEHNRVVMRIAKGESTISKELPKLGRFLRDVMMGVIQVGGPGFESNSPETVARKGSSRPLIDTTTLVNDIESRLVKDVSRKKQKGLNKAIL